MTLPGTVTILALFFTSLTAQATSKLFSANQYGAVANSTTLNTAAIQRTIDAAARSHGTVTFAPGTYLTGSIFVKIGVTLQLDQGVILLGSQNLADYPVMPTRMAGIEMFWPAAFVNIYGQKDATVRGAGTIDGDGKIFWDSYWTSLGLRL